MNNLIDQKSNRQIKKTAPSQDRILSGQKTNPNNFIIKKLPSFCDSQLTLQDSKQLNPISQNQNTPINNTKEKLFFSNKQEIQEKQHLQQQKSKNCRKPPRPYAIYKTEIEEIKFNQQYFQNKNEKNHLQQNDSNQNQGIANELQKKYVNKISQENIFQKSEQKEEINNVTISLQNEQYNNTDSNYTVPITRKQKGTKIILKNSIFNNQDDHNFEFKKDHCKSIQQDFKLTETNFENAFGNKQQTQYQNDVINQINQQGSYDTLKLNIQQQQSKHITKLNFIKKISNANFQDQQHIQNNSEETKRQEVSQNIITNQIYQNQQSSFNQLSDNSQIKFIKQLEKIYFHNTKYLFFKCKNEYCNYFCILTSFHRQDYYCQQCEMLSVIGDVSKKRVMNKCNHTLNYKDIIYIVQDAIQFKKLARCSSCKWEISYTLIKRIDLSKQYIYLKLQLEVQILKNCILKIPKFQIAECTGPECDFFTIWNSNQPKLKQGFCIFCDKRIAFKMDHLSQNILYQINCGHELTAQKLLGLSSDAQILKDFAKCPQCQVIISLKQFKQFESQGEQYIQYALNKQLDILKQQFYKQEEIVLCQCSTHSCPFFYVFQNKTICNSQNQIVFAKQFNCQNQKISSFCPNCNQVSIQSEFIQRKNIQRRANIQFK